MGEVHKLEDWTQDDPLVRENRQLRQDLDMMAREILRLRHIERLAVQVVELHARGDFMPAAPLACHTLVELGSALLLPPAWRDGN